MTDNTAQRVEPGRIQELMDSLRYTVTRTPNAASTTATASLPWGFVVATGNSGCLDMGAFDEDTSRKMAIADATIKARDALFQFEAYRISYELAHAGQPG